VFLKDSPPSLIPSFIAVLLCCIPLCIHLFRPPVAMQQQPLWFRVLVCGLLSLTCVPADNVHPERGQMLQRVKRALADLTSENQVGHVVPCTIMQTWLLLYPTLSTDNNNVLASISCILRWPTSHDTIGNTSCWVSGFPGVRPLMPGLGDDFWLMSHTKNLPIVHKSGSLIDNVSPLSGSSGLQAVSWWPNIVWNWPENLVGPWKKIRPLLSAPCNTRNIHSSNFSWFELQEVPWGVLDKPMVLYFYKGSKTSPHKFASNSWST
jgi:hypothetical protein